MSDRTGPRIIGNALGAVNDAAAAGAVWRIAEEPRELDANVIRLPPGDRVDAPAGTDLDVLILVLDGSGEIRAGGDTRELAAGDIGWLPARAGRSIVAGPDGLAYFSVHRRRPPRGIGRPG